MNYFPKHSDTRWFHKRWAEMRRYDAIAMLTPFTFSSSIPCGRPSHHLALLLLVLIKLITSGCAALPGNNGIAHTATVISLPAFVHWGSDHETNPYYPAAVPQKIVCRSQEEAQKVGQSLARQSGSDLLITSGTSSMLPLISGKAYVVVQYRTYDTINRGELLVYQGRPNAAKNERICMLHRAVMMDKDGWVMSGDNNRWSESWDRVTPVTYLGTVTTILEFPQTI